MRSELHRHRCQAGTKRLMLVPLATFDSSRRNKRMRCREPSGKLAGERTASPLDPMQTGRHSTRAAARPPAHPRLTRACRPSPSSPLNWVCRLVARVECWPQRSAPRRCSAPRRRGAACAPSQHLLVASRGRTCAQQVSGGWGFPQTELYSAPPLASNASLLPLTSNLLWQRLQRRGAPMRGSTRAALALAPLR